MVTQWARNIQKLALVFVGMFFLSACVVTFFLYLSYQEYGVVEVKAALDSDIRGLADVYRFTGRIEAVQQAIESRLEEENPSSFYLLGDNEGRVLAGNILAYPEYTESLDGDYRIFEIAFSDLSDRSPMVRDPYPAHFDVMTRSIELGKAQDGVIVTLLVGRDIEEFQVSQQAVVSLGWLTIALVMLMALIGFFIVYKLMQRVQLIQQTARTVIATGDLSARIPVDEAVGDFKPLADMLNEMLERIEDSVNGIRQVSDSIAHDLRTPLTRLHQHISALKDGQEGASIDDIAEETRHIITTFNALLRIANAENKQQRAGFTQIDISTLLEDLYEYYDVLCQEHKQTLEINIPSQLPRVMGDKDLLFQAFSNLIENAIKFTPVGGQIRIGATTDEQGVAVSVVDSGIGVPDEDKKKVFQRFYRAEQNRNTPGNGLGLAMVKAVADLHQASIALSDNESAGLRIEIRFPIGPDEC